MYLSFRRFKISYDLITIWNFFFFDVICWKYINLSKTVYFLKENCLFKVRLCWYILFGKYIHAPTRDGKKFVDKYVAGQFSPRLTPPMFVLNSLKIKDMMIWSLGSNFGQNETRKQKKSLSFNLAKLMQLMSRMDNR